MRALRALGLFVGLALASGCGQPPPDAAATAESTAAAPTPTVAPARPGSAPGTPRLVVARTTVDLGRVPQTRKSTDSLEFTNEGSGPLVIEKIDTTCGCTAVTLDRREYAPGESGSLHIEFDPTAPGSQKKQITIISNDPQGPAVVRVVAEVQPFIAVEPTMLRLGVRPLGQASRAEVTVTSPVPGFRIDGISASNRHVAAEVAGPTDARAGSAAWRVRITIAPETPWGGFFSWLYVTGTGQPDGVETPVTHTTQIRIQGQIFGQVHADRDTFRYGVQPGERFVREITLTRADGAPLTVSTSGMVAGCLDDPTVRIEPLDPASVKVVLTATGRSRGRCDGEVIVSTNVPGETRIRLPIVGVVR